MTHVIPPVDGEVVVPRAFLDIVGEYMRVADDPYSEATIRVDAHRKLERALSSARASPPTPRMEVTDEMVERAARAMDPALFALWDTPELKMSGNSVVATKDVIASARRALTAANHAR